MGSRADGAGEKQRGEGRKHPFFVWPWWSRAVPLRWGAIAGGAGFGGSLLSFMRINRS